MGLSQVHCLQGDLKETKVLGQLVGSSNLDGWMDQHKGSFSRKTIPQCWAGKEYNFVYGFDG